MIRVTVRVFAALRDRLGWKERVYEADVEDVEGLLKLVQANGDKMYDVVVDKAEGRVTQYKVMVDGRDIEFLDGLGTKLSSGVVVTIFPPVGGG